MTSLLVTPLGRRRATDATGYTEEKLVALLELLAQTFDLLWLNEDDESHRLRELWWRDDYLASLELVTIADSVRVMNDINPRWVAGVVGDIKKKAENSHGYIFELIATAMLARGGMKLSPMAKGEPAYDVKVQFDDGFEILLSLKNHDLSQFETKFRHSCDEIRSLARQRFYGHIHSFAMHVDSPTYIDSSLFSGLKKIVVHAPLEVITDSGFPFQNPSLFVKLSKPNLAADDQPLHHGHYSDTVRVICRQHRNEQLNFKSKVEEAEEKFGKIPTPDPSKQARLVLLRLHATADINYLCAAAQKMLDEDPSLNVDGFLFLQPAVVRSEGRSTICYHLRFAGSASRYPKNRLTRFAPLFGVLSANPTETRLRGNGIDQLVGESYVYQRADHYVKANQRSDGSHYLEINSPANGVHVHAVFDMLGQSLAIGGKSPDFDELRVI